MNCMDELWDDQVARAEVQQFEGWSFNRQLAYASQKGLAFHPPGLGPKGKPNQDGVPDPLQDHRQGPWTEGKNKTAPAAVLPSGPQAPVASACDQKNDNKAEGPQRYYMTPPKSSIRGIDKFDTPSSIELWETTHGMQDQVVKTSKATVSRI